MAEQMQGQPVPPPPPTGHQSPNGTTILILGIIGFFCFITGIIAWIMGAKELKIYPNDSSVKAGWICGIISTILAIIGIIIYIVLIVFIFTKMRDAGFSMYGR